MCPGCPRGVPGVSLRCTRDVSRMRLGCFLGMGRNPSCLGKKGWEWDQLDPLELHQARGNREKSWEWDGGWDFSMPHQARSTGKFSAGEAEISPGFSFWAVPTSLPRAWKIRLLGNSLDLWDLLRTRTRFSRFLQEGTRSLPPVAAPGRALPSQTVFGANPAQPFPSFFPIPLLLPGRRKTLPGI